MVAARSRRGFLRVAGISVVSAAPVLLGACGDDGDERPTKSGPADVDILNNLLDLEYQAAAAYETGLPLLEGAVRTLGERFLAQEREQAAALAAGVKRLGGTPSPPVAHALPARRTQLEVLGFADSLETLTVSAYIDALPKITDDALRGTAAAIMTTSAEHVLVLRTEQGGDADPETFVS